MPNILDTYKQLIIALDSISLPTERAGNNAVEEYLKDLYNIAKDMIKFQDLHGNLQYNYGQGALIEKFSNHFNGAELPQDVKNSYQKFFQDLDIENHAQIYEHIALEYKQYANINTRKIEKEIRDFFAKGSYIENDQAPTSANLGKHTSSIQQRRSHKAGCHIS